MPKTLSAEARKKRNEYAKKWRKNHREKVREYNRRYWEKKADSINSPIDDDVDMIGGDER